MAAEAGWEHFWHVADIGVHGWGPTLQQAFEQGALALTGVITEPGKIREETPVDIECVESDRELLFMEWLNAIIYEMAVRNCLFGRFIVQLDESSLKASAWGERVDVERHQPAVEVKGATLTCLKVQQDESGTWHARCVVDV